MNFFIQIFSIPLKHIFLTLYKFSYDLIEKKKSYTSNMVKVEYCWAIYRVTVSNIIWCIAENTPLAKNRPKIFFSSFFFMFLHFFDFSSFFIIFHFFSSFFIFFHLFSSVSWILFTSVAFFKQNSPKWVKLVKSTGHTVTIITNITIVTLQLTWIVNVVYAVDTS